MIKTIGLYEFRQAFIDYNRQDNFSYGGLGLLFDYFEMVEDVTGDPIELDVIAICCDFSEDGYEEIADYYSIDISGFNEDESRTEVVEYLEENSFVVGVTDDSIIYQQF